jgi:putative glycosyltransferase (TIGR04372 family)
MKSKIRKWCVNALRRAFRACPLIRPLALEIAARLPIPLLRGHAFYRKGHAYLRRNDVSRAFDAFSRSIDDIPNHPASFLYRGKIHLELGNYAAAEEDFRVAESLRPLPLADQHLELLRCRATTLIQLKQLSEGLKYYARASCMQQLQQNAQPSRSPCQTQLQVALIDAHDMLAEDVINRFGEFHLAFEIYQRKWELQQELARHLQIDKLGLLVLSEDWVRNVGHIGFVDFIVKMQRLGWAPWKEIVLLAPPERSANRSFVQFWSRHISVVTDPFLIERFAPLAIATGNRVAGAVRTPRGDIRYFLDAIGSVQSHWEQAGGHPLLELDENDHRRGRPGLQQLGIPDDAWFVCVHVRESGFHRQGDPRHQAHRDSDIETYIPAFREITSRGGWVIRMGDPSMKRLPALERVVDYAHSPAKSEWMDVYLSGACRFFIGVASGLSHVAFSFGRPCVYTNWISNVLPPYAGSDLYVMKLLKTASTGRLLTLSEMLDFSLRRKCYSNLLLHEDGIEYENNSPEDLRDAVREMLDQLDGTIVVSQKDRELQAAFDRIAASHSLFDYCRPGYRFLRRHAELLAGDLPASEQESADCVAAAA